MIKLWRLVILVLFTQLAIGCDMPHVVGVKLRDGMTLGDSQDNKSFTVHNVMSALTPVIAKYDLKCRENQKQSGLEIRCKTWPFSRSELRVFENLKKGGAAVIIVIDDLPAFLWTPQPYGKIKTDVLNILKKEFRFNQLECAQGFGFVVRCEEWSRSQ